MTLRLVALHGSVPELRRFADVALLAAADGFGAITDACVAATQVTGRALVAPLRIVWAALLLSPFIALILWSFGHADRLRQRIAREGCPYAEDADVARLPGAREREFHSRYC